MTLCDTDVIVEMLKGREPVFGTLRRLGLADLRISAVKKAELIYGALNKRDLAFILKGISAIQVMPVEPEISELAVNLMQEHTLSNRLALPDALIAATALHHGLPLYTLNRKDFRYIGGLQLHEPA